jgi:hypothetical protein
VQATLFWLTGGAFFALQTGILLYLLYASPAQEPADTEGRRRRVEIVWTLVPAALLVAVVLMMSGFTGSSWSRVRAAGPGTAPIVVQHLDVRLVQQGVAR